MCKLQYKTAHLLRSTPVARHNWSCWVYDIFARYNVTALGDEKPDWPSPWNRSNLFSVGSVSVNLFVSFGAILAPLFVYFIKARPRLMYDKAFGPEKNSCVIHTPPNPTKNELYGSLCIFVLGRAAHLYRRTYEHLVQWAYLYQRIHFCSWHLDAKVAAYAVVSCACSDCHTQVNGKVSGELSLFPWSEHSQGV